MKKGKIIPLVIGSAVLASGAAAVAAAKLLGKGEAAEETPAEESEAVEETVQEAVEETVQEAVEETVQETAEETFQETDEDTVREQEEEKPEEDNKAMDLEEYIEENPDEKASLDAVKDSFAEEGVRTDISCSGNTMFFDFVMTDVFDEETKEILKPDLEAFLDAQTESYKEIVKQIEEDTGFDSIKMIVIFMDADENEIVSGHYDSTGRTL